MSAEADFLDLYAATIARVEPDIVTIDAGAANASIAISLKRIADVLDRVEAKLTAPALFEIAKAVKALVEAEDLNSNQDIQR